MTIALEPMVMLGSYMTRVLPDEWTVVSKDGELTAHFEHTVAITENGPQILTTHLDGIGIERYNLYFVGLTKTAGIIEGVEVT